MKKNILRGACRVVVSILLFMSIMIQDSRARYILADTHLDTRTLAMINKPGVVLVQTVWTADLTLYEFAFVSEFEDDIANEVEYLVASGSIPDTEQAIYAVMVQLMIENMQYYAFSTGNVYTEKASTAAVGTGFIVSPDGYLITNAHVVATNEDELYMNFVMSALNDYALEGTNSFAAEMRTLGYQMNQEEFNGMLYTFYDLLAASLDINNLQTSYKCYLGNVTPGSDVSGKGVGLDLRKMGEPIPGKDIAILKLDKINLPTVSLGDDSKLRTGDKVYAMGYPAVATLNDALNVSQAIQEPTLTSGIISAKKEMAGGWNILQTDAAIHGGNSGGPLFNEAGEVIGINTFGMVDANNGTQVAGMNFAIPVSIAVQFLNEINVTPSESQFTSQYKKAISFYKEQEYDSALDILRGLNETNPGFPMVADLLAECRILADEQPKINPVEPIEPVVAEVQSKDTSKTMGDKKSITAIGVIGVAVLVVFIVIILGIILLVKGKKKKLKGVEENKVATNDVSKDLETKNCTHCGKAAPQGSKFCNGCGNAFSSQPLLPDKCPKCNHPIESGTMFCSGCGAKFIE